MGERCGAVTEPAILPIHAAGCSTTASAHVDSSVMPSFFTTASESASAPTGATGQNAVMAYCTIQEFQRTHILLAQTGPKRGHQMG